MYQIITPVSWMAHTAAMLTQLLACLCAKIGDVLMNGGEVDLIFLQLTIKGIAADP